MRIRYNLVSSSFRFRCFPLRLQFLLYSSGLLDNYNELRKTSRSDCSVCKYSLFSSFSLISHAITLSLSLSLFALSMANFSCKKLVPVRSHFAFPSSFSLSLSLSFCLAGSANLQFKTLCISRGHKTRKLFSLVHSSRFFFSLKTLSVISLSFIPPSFFLHYYKTCE